MNSPDPFENDIFLPMFPLELVVFPNEQLNLHIFEEKYKEMINECEEEGKSFGVPPFIDGKISDYGTEVNLTAIEKRYDDGEMDIRTRGSRVFRIKKFYQQAPNKLYAGAYIEFVEDEVSANDNKNLLQQQILEQVRELYGILNINKGLPERTEDVNVFKLAHHIGLSTSQEFDFLCLFNEEKRQQYMLNHLEKFIPIVQQMEQLRKRIKMNGHFQPISPPDLLE